MPRIDRSEGRRLFGSDPAAYAAARPGHAERVYEVLAERCGLGPGTRVLEIDPGTGQATRRLLALGANVATVEPDPYLAAYLERGLAGRLEIHVSPLEEARLGAGGFDLAVAASSFHWVDEPTGLLALHSALRPDGWFAMWWTLFGEPGQKDAFMRAVDPFLEGLSQSPTAGDSGRPPFALDVEARSAALASAGFAEIAHESFGGAHAGTRRASAASTRPSRPSRASPSRAAPRSSTESRRSQRVTSQESWSGSLLRLCTRRGALRHETAPGRTLRNVATRTMLPVHETGTCSVATTAEIVGSKWTVLIVHDLSEGPRRFTELEHSCAGISPRTLAERLRWLEGEGILVRRSYQESPPRVEYELTDKGRALLPIVDEMRRFGHDWLGCGVHDTPAPR